MKRTQLLIAYASLIGFTMTIGALAADNFGPSFAIDWYTIDGGGGTSTGGDFSLSGTIGQPDADSMSGGAFELAGGFWAANGAQPSCSADIASSTGPTSDGLVDVFDLLEVLDNWGTAGNGAAIAPPANVVDVFDLLDLLSAWGTCA